VEDDKGEPVDSVMEGVEGDVVFEEGAEKRITKK